MRNNGMITSMDNIIIPAKTGEKHHEIILEVLKTLQDNQLCIAPDKCEWAKHQDEFLEYMLSGQEFVMTDEMVPTLMEIETIKTLPETLHFLGLTNFYHPFIKDYSIIVLPLTNLSAH